MVTFDHRVKLVVVIKYGDLPRMTIDHRPSTID